MYMYTYARRVFVLYWYGYHMRAHKDAKSGFREPQDFVVLLQSFAGPVTWSDLAPCATFQDVFRPCVDESAMDQLATAHL